MKDAVELAEFLVDNPSQVSLPGLSVSERSQELMAGYDDAHSDPTATLIAETDKILSRADAVDNLVVVRLPSVVTAQAKVARKNVKRVGIVECVSTCPIMLADLLLWMLDTPDSDLIANVADRYPVLFEQKFLLSRTPTVRLERASEAHKQSSFVVHWKLLERVNAALTQWYDRQDQSHAVEPEEDEIVPVAYVATDVGAFTRRYMQQVFEYYAIVKDLKRYRQDLEWLQTDWSKVEDIKQPFLEHIKQKPSVLAKEVAQLFHQSPLSQQFVTPSGPTGRRVTASLRDVIGRLARTARINDVVMNAALICDSSYVSGCYVIASVTVEQKAIVIPDCPLASCSFVLVPGFMQSAKHWMIQIVELDMDSKNMSANTIKATFYDPLGMTTNTTTCETTWICYTLPLLREWLARDVARDTLLNKTRPSKAIIRQIKRESGKARTHTKSNDCGSLENEHATAAFPFLTTATCKKPTQDDPVSCGVFCIAQACSFVFGKRTLERNNRISASDLEIMRLQLLWIILTEGGAHTKTKDKEHSTDKWIKLQQLNRKIKQAFPIDA